MRSALEQLAEAIEQAPEFLGQLDDTLADMAVGAIGTVMTGHPGPARPPRFGSCTLSLRRQ